MTGSLPRSRRRRHVRWRGGESSSNGNRPPPPVVLVLVPAAVEGGGSIRGSTWAVQLLQPGSITSMTTVSARTWNQDRTLTKTSHSARSRLERKDAAPVCSSWGDGTTTKGPDRRKQRRQSRRPPRRKEGEEFWWKVMKMKTGRAPHPARAAARGA